MPNPAPLDFSIQRLGEPRILSPMEGIQFVDEGDTVLYSSDWREVRRALDQHQDPPRMERAGPRGKIFFDPSKLKCGIVTCGGICPGLNDVIRAIVMSLYHHYGVRGIYGFRYGFEGLVARYGHPPIDLTPEYVSRIHERGGTILGSSRGPQDLADMVDTFERMNIGILFTIGGDGTLRGAMALADEVKKRGLRISIIGIPKTIDNDISYIQSSFGFETACAEARHVITGANAEAMGARNGIGLVKLMGRDSGFIAAFSTLANNDVNFCLVPEIPFTLEGFLKALRDRLERRGHAVIVVAEGAGPELVRKGADKDASGNVRHGDIGRFLRDEIKKYFTQLNIDINLKYIDPSYTIRSLPSNSHDAAFCMLLGHNAVHAAMSGRTNMVVGNWMGEFTHVPIALAVSQRKKIDPRGWLWRSVVSTTGQAVEAF